MQVIEAQCFRSWRLTITSISTMSEWVRCGGQLSWGDVAQVVLRLCIQAGLQLPGPAEPEPAVAPRRAPGPGLSLVTGCAASSTGPQIVCVSHGDRCLKALGVPVTPALFPCRRRVIPACLYGYVPARRSAGCTLDWQCQGALWAPSRAAPSWHGWWTARPSRRWPTASGCPAKRPRR